MMSGKKVFPGSWLGSGAGEEQGGTVRLFGCNAFALRAVAAAQDETWIAGENNANGKRQYNKKAGPTPTAVGGRIKKPGQGVAVDGSSALGCWRIFGAKLLISRKVGR